MAAVWDWVLGVCVGLCVCVLGCAEDVLGASLLRLIVQMDDLYGGVYLFCGKATSGDLLFPGVAEFFTLLHIPGTIFHPHTPNPQTDLFTGSLPVHIYPLPTHAYILLQTRMLMHILYAINSRRVQAPRTTNTPLARLNVWAHPAHIFYLCSAVFCMIIFNNAAIYTILFRSMVSSWWGYNCSHIFHTQRGLFLSVGRDKMENKQRQ